MKSFITFLTCLIGSCPTVDTQPPASEHNPIHVAYLESAAHGNFERDLRSPFDGKSLAGNYLASLFAQHRHDWEKATLFMDQVLVVRPDDLQNLNKAMILAMGSGQHEKAVSFAQAVAEVEKDNSLALLFLAADAFHREDYDAAAQFVENMPDGSLSDFMMPLLQSWAKAGTGELDTKNLNQNTIHIYHAILIADYLGQHGDIEGLLQKSLGAQGLTVEDIQKTADVYAHIGKSEIALDLYKKALEKMPENATLTKKIADLQANKTESIFDSVHSPKEGVAEALYDMGLLLYREYSDDSARVFAHMSLFLHPSLTNSKLLLAHITARNEQYDKAIAYYQTIKSDNEKFLEARRMAANLLEDSNRIEEALTELEVLFREHDDVDSLIQIGDIYRRNEEFGKAIITYNQVEEKLGSEVPKEYWHLHYVRGMSYEQNGQWDKAEADLQAALSFQPNHPLVLNYLGYAWADQGVNLSQSLELIRKAVAAQPTDGYIIDSLGWVLFRMGRYKEAVPHLEKAVELLPYDPVINDHLGDAYWQVGRKLEAHFQWTRAGNHAEDEQLKLTIADKLENGLQAVEVVKEASTESAKSLDESIIEH